MYASTFGAAVEIRPFGCLNSNSYIMRTLFGG